MRLFDLPRTGRSLHGIVLTAAIISAAGAAPAAQQTGQTVTVPISTAYGVCPPAIAVELASTQYEGGNSLDVIALTMDAAFASKLMTATPQRVVFAADLRARYATCEGLGRSGNGQQIFRLHDGELYSVLKVDARAGSVRIGDVRTIGGAPHAKIETAD